MTALQAGAVRQRFTALGVEAVGSNPKHFAAYIKSEIVKWGKAVRATGLQKQ